MKTIPFSAVSRAARGPAWVQQGFTLVELMISMVIGLFIVLALLTMLINVNRNNSELTKTNRVIENGRFALQLFQSDISHGGFWGGYVPKFDDLTFTGAPLDVPTTVPDPCLAYTSWDAAYRDSLIGLPLQSYAVGTATVPVCASKTPNAKAGSDMLIVRHLEPCIAGPIVDTGCTVASSSPNDVFFQFEHCTGPGASTATYALGTTATTTFNGTKRDCTTPANVYKFVSNLYYVRDYASTVGDGIPTLMRSEFGDVAGVPTQKPAEAMIEGVEEFRVEFGIDNVSDSGSAVTTATIAWADPNVLTSPTNRGDGIPDDQALGNGAYIRCDMAGTAPCTVDRMRNTVAAKVYVLVRSDKKTPDYVDAKTYNLGSRTYTPNTANQGYKRHLFSQTIRLVNVSARRETPP